ncbi:excinuclease ABC subunit UvrC [bacterium]|nr:excinuclease ABC subunit UvrC [bacterium]
MIESNNTSPKNDPTLQEKLELLPKDPGCYLFKDAKGKIIYVGKAKVLRNRVRSYFNGTSDGRYQYDLLTQRIKDVEVIATRTEIEALVLEANLIRRHRPRFNIDVRDDRSYPYLKVTNEPFPRIFLTRNPKEDGSEYYGPLTDVMQIKDTVNALRQACHIRVCNLKITDESVAKKKHRLCLEYHIGNCEGPCEGLVDADQYNRGVKALVDTVNGKNDDLSSVLRDRMTDFSRKLKFEQAARVRDQLNAIETMTKKQKVTHLDEEDRDVFGGIQIDKEACITVMRIRSGRLVGRHHSFLRRFNDESWADIWAHYLVDYYTPSTRMPPERIILPEPMNKEDEELIRAFLSEKRGRRVLIMTPQRGERVRLLELAKRNAELLLKEQLLAKENRERIPQSLVMLKEHLDLDDLPRIIECFDNSNLMGTNPVAAMVHFRDAKPVKKHYRHFKIKTVAGIDDFASMQEVVGRRYRRVLKERENMPQLILIDGGIGQLNAARKVLDDLGLTNVPAVGLAKRLEEIYMPGQPGPITLPKTSSALKLLMRIRDETHRFAITYHRSLRTKNTISTTLVSVPGIGEAKAKALLKHFGSLKRLRDAKPEDIAKVPGFSVKGGEELLRRLDEADKNTAAGS